jgi:cytochrome c peroxidase
MKSSIAVLTLTIAVFFTFAAPSQGQVLSKTCKHITDQVLLGECLFNKETFEGNGRTCASCHPPENNFTIDPKFIANLPANDKLFVFEDPAFPGLNGQCRPAGGSPTGQFCSTDTECGIGETCDSLENGVLMRKYGLILENVDGLTEPGRMRSVPHTLSMTTSLTNSFGPAPTGTKGHGIGWSGDGSPGTVGSVDSPFSGFCDSEPTLYCQGFSQADANASCGAEGPCNGRNSEGDLNSFSVGATIQHATKDLRRRIGMDFRLPTPDERDAMAAYQLSLGRQSDDPNIKNVEYKNDFVNEGRDNFFEGNRCSLCHEHAAANASFTGGTVNFNFNTGVEDLTNPHILENVGALPDGGFNGGVNGFCTIPDPGTPLAAGTLSCSGSDQTAASASCAVGTGPCVLIDDSIGDGTQNTPPLIEAADTGPFFHNNESANIEAGVGFYQSSNFSRGIRGPRLDMTADTVNSISAWLRVINVLFNVDQAKKFLAETDTKGCSKQLVKLALADIEDAYQVLEGSEYKMFGEAVDLLKEAYKKGSKVKAHKTHLNLTGFKKKAKKCNGGDSKKITKINGLLDEVKGLIVEP